jgi:hypothetical protein
VQRKKGADWFLSMRPSAIVCLEFCVSVYHGKFYHSEMTDITLRYGSADGVALRAQALYCEKFPARRVPHSQKFLAAVQRLRESGTFRMRSADRGQEPTPRVLDLEPQILEIVEQNPSTCTRQLARKFHVSQFMVCRTLKEQELWVCHNNVNVI